MTIHYKDKSLASLKDTLRASAFIRRVLLSPPALFCGVFAIFYLFIFWNLHFISARDPTSFFFDAGLAYEKEYSLKRIEEAETCLKDANRLERPERSVGQVPKLCVGVATVARRGQQYVGLTVGSLLAGLSTTERQDVFLNLLIAHTTPSQHPAYAEQWVELLPDRVLQYNDDTATMEKIRMWEADGWYRNKTIYDYTYLLGNCYDTGAEYIAMLEDDTLAVEGWFSKAMGALQDVKTNMRTRSQAERWIYLRLFYADELLGWNSEAWPRYLLASFVIWATVTGSMMWVRRKLRRDVQSTFTPVAIATSGVVIPTFIVLFFMAGKQTVMPIREGISVMNKYGCCSQGFIFPRSIIPDFLACTDLTTDWLVDMMIEKIANQEGWTRWVTVPSLLQHIGATSSKGYGFDADQLPVGNDPLQLDDSGNNKDAKHISLNDNGNKKASPKAASEAIAGGQRLAPKSVTNLWRSRPCLRQGAVSLARHAPFSVYSSQRGSVPDFAFVFDIDGVLVRSSRLIPGASESLNFLQSNQVPFLLLTNGGGRHESQRVTELSKSLGVKLDTSMFVQSHTPFADLVHTENMKDKCILVVGGDSGLCRDVAQQYGFTNVITPGDIYAAHPETWPFSKNFGSYYSEFAKALPKPINPGSPQDSLKIDAIFIYNDPRDWGLDLQLILDLLLSKEGILGTYSAKNGNRSLPNNGYLQDGQPPLYCSNADLLWAASYHLSRLGQGGFHAALDGVWNAITGGPHEGAHLHKIVIGKPFKVTYEFSERKLLKHRDSLFVNGGASPLKRVYMVGDNPESDIRGANTFESPHGIEWISLLTRTGVYKARPGSTPRWQPREIVDDVKAAVQYALKDSAWTSPILE
ncbi:hypothetical protein DV736_g1337, partial [Chaetothyriales sp. CBS 134916]